MWLFREVVYGMLIINHEFNCRSSCVFTVGMHISAIQTYTLKLWVPHGTNNWFLRFCARGTTFKTIQNQFKWLFGFNLSKNQLYITPHMKTFGVCLKMMKLGIMNGLVMTKYDRVWNQRSSCVTDRWSINSWVIMSQLEPNLVLNEPYLFLCGNDSIKNHYLTLCGQRPKLVLYRNAVVLDKSFSS